MSMGVQRESAEPDKSTVTAKRELLSWDAWSAWRVDRLAVTYRADRFAATWVRPLRGHTQLRLPAVTLK